MKSTTTGYDPSIHHLLRQIENNGTLTHNIIPSNTHMLVVPRLTPGRRAPLLCVCHRVCHGCSTKGGCCDPPVVAFAGWQLHAALPLSKSTKNMANPRGSYIFGGCSCVLIAASGGWLIVFWWVVSACFNMEFFFRDFCLLLFFSSLALWLLWLLWLLWVCMWLLWLCHALPIYLSI
jgi:hypothetical protein